MAEATVVREGLTLREYQVRALTETMAAMAEGKRTVCAGPTGCGKSAIASAIARAFERPLVLSPRLALKDQLAETVGAFWRSGPFARTGSASQSTCTRSLLVRLAVAGCTPVTLMATR